jgi:tetratricopeptide (TPR) repeat protein
MKWKMAFESICLLVVLTGLWGCVGAPSSVEGLLSMDEALTQAAAEIEAGVAAGSEITVAAIIAPNTEIGNFLAEELAVRINRRGNLTVLARGTALNALTDEQRVQMSGLVSDESAVGIGRFLGAKAVVSGSFDRYQGFCQLRLRTVDVETSALAASFAARIRNSDPVLANLTASLPAAQAARISEQALVHLNKGKDLLAVKAYDGAVGEFDRALALDQNLAEAYLYRGKAYYWLVDLDIDAILADYNRAIALNPDYAEAYYERGYLYRVFGLERAMYWGNPENFDIAIADFTRAIRLKPDFAEAYYVRGVVYDWGYGVYDTRPEFRAAFSHYSSGKWQAEEDYNQAIRLDPDNDRYYYTRASFHLDKYREFYDNNRQIYDYDRVYGLDRAYSYNLAIADYTQLISRNIQEYWGIGNAYLDRGNLYLSKRDYDRAIADFEAGLRIAQDSDYPPGTPPSPEHLRERLETARRRGR